MPIALADAGSMQRLNVTSPMDGVVIRRGVELGDTVTSGVSSFNAGTVLMTVADVGTMIIKAGINEVDIGKVRLEQPVKISLDAYPKVKFAGAIKRIAPAARLEEKVKVFDVEIAIDRQGAELRTGMTANIDVLGERRDKVLTVPVEALFRRDDKEVVYIKKSEAPKRPSQGASGSVFADGKKDGHAEAGREGRLEGEVRAARDRDGPRELRQGRDRDGPRGRRGDRGRGPDAAEGEEGP